MDPSQQMFWNNGKTNNTGIKYTMSNDNFAVYTGYQYWVDMQWYEIIEVDVYI